MQKLLTCSLGNASHLKFHGLPRQHPCPSILTPSTVPRAGAQCPAPFAVAAQTWPQSPPFVASAGGQLLLRRWVHSGKKPVLCRWGFAPGQQEPWLHPAIPLESRIPSIQLTKLCLTIDSHGTGTSADRPASLPPSINPDG